MASPASPWTHFRQSAELHDVRVLVESQCFLLHRFPLFLKSKTLKEKLHFQNAVAMAELQLEHHPGGSEAFHAVADYCYGITPSFTATTAAHTLLAALQLEMTDEYSPPMNLVSVCTAFLQAEVYSGWEACLVLLRDSVVREYKHSLGKEIVSACNKTISEYAASIDKLDDPMERVLKTWNLLNKVVALPFEALEALLSTFEEHEVTFIKTGNSLSSTGKEWMFAPAVDDPDLTMFSDLQISPAEGRKQLQALLGYLVKMLSTPTSVAKEGCGPNLHPNPSYLVTLLRYSQQVQDSKLTLELYRRLSNELPKINFEDLKSLDQGDVCTLFTLYSNEIQADESEASEDLIAVAKLQDSYILWAVQEVESFTLDDLHIMCETLPKFARLCCDDLYKAIDMFLKKNPKVSQEDRVRICDNLVGENPEILKLSEKMILHALEEGRFPTEGKFFMAMFRFQREAFMLEKTKREEQAKEVESLRMEVEKWRQGRSYFDCSLAEPHDLQEANIEVSRALTCYCAELLQRKVLAKNRTRLWVFPFERVQWGVKFCRLAHAKDALEAYIASIMFANFENECFSPLEFSVWLDPTKRRRDAFQHFKELKEKERWTIEEKEERFNSFVDDKFRAIFYFLKDKVTLYPDSESLEDYFNVRRRNSKLMALCKAVWSMHKLAQGFNPPASIFRVARGAAFDPALMKLVSSIDSSEIVTVQQVAFSVTPGFRVRESVIPSHVYPALA